MIFNFSAFECMEDIVKNIINCCFNGYLKTIMQNVSTVGYTEDVKCVSTISYQGESKGCPILSIKFNYFQKPVLLLDHGNKTFNDIKKKKQTNELHSTK